MKQTLVALAIMASFASVASAAEAPKNSITGNSNVTQAPDASVDKANHANNDNVSTVNGTTIDPVITNQYTDTSNRSASATGGTYTTGALTAAGGSNGDQTMGDSTSSVGNTTASTGASNSHGGNHKNVATYGAQTSKSHTGNNTNGLSQGVGVNTGATKVQSGQAAKTGNNTTTVDAADRSTTNYKSLALALPTIQSAPATHLAVGNISQHVSQCSPRVVVYREKVKGEFMGLIKRTKLDQGYDYHVAPADEPFRMVQLPNGEVLLMGHQVITSTTVIGLGGARSLTLGGGGQGAGSFGQAGASNSSQAQRLVTNVQAVECVYGQLKQAEAVKVRG